MFKINGLQGGENVWWLYLADSSRSSFIFNSNPVPPRWFHLKFQFHSSRDALRLVRAGCCAKCGPLTQHIQVFHSYQLLTARTAGLCAAPLNVAPHSSNYFDINWTPGPSPAVHDIISVVIILGTSSLRLVQLVTHCQRTINCFYRALTTPSPTTTYKLSCSAPDHTQTQKILSLNYPTITWNPS